LFFEGRVRGWVVGVVQRERGAGAQARESGEPAPAALKFF
jgi:hypothetical protein